jgi:hypothetical protein
VTRHRTNKPLPADHTKVSYILSLKEKAKLEKDARREGVSMSEIISRALTAYRHNGGSA